MTYYTYYAMVYMCKHCHYVYYVIPLYYSKLYCIVPYGTILLCKNHIITTVNYGYELQHCMPLNYPIKYNNRNYAVAKSIMTNYNIERHIIPLYKLQKH